MKAGWLLLAFGGLCTLAFLTSTSWRLSTQAGDVMAHAFIDSAKDPALLRFKTGEQGADRPDVDFYVYSVTNAEEVMTGAKPRMEAIGPFQYVEESDVSDVVVQDGFTSFSASKKYAIRGSDDGEMQ